MKYWIGIVSLLFVASCQMGSSGEAEKFKTIMLKSDGMVETLPDMASFQINLNCLDKSIGASKKCLVDKSTELNTKLQSFGIGKNDILTTSVDLNKSYTWKNNSNVFEGYNASTSIYVTIKNIDKLDEIYTELLENRNLDLCCLTYSHSKIDSLKNEAYLIALRKSGELADKLLNELPESKKEIRKIGNVEISASIPDIESKNLRADKNEEIYASPGKSISISKGTVVVNASIFVEYQIY